MSPEARSNISWQTLTPDFRQSISVMNNLATNEHNTPHIKTIGYYFQSILAGKKVVENPSQTTSLSRLLPVRVNKTTIATLLEGLTSKTGSLLPHPAFRIKKSKEVTFKPDTQSVANKIAEQQGTVQQITTRLKGESMDPKINLPSISNIAGLHFGVLNPEMSSGHHLVYIALGNRAIEVNTRLERIDNSVAMLGLLNEEGLTIVESEYDKICRLLASIKDVQMERANDEESLRRRDEKLANHKRKFT